MDLIDPKFDLNEFQKTMLELSEAYDSGYFKNSFGEKGYAQIRKDILRTADLLESKFNLVRLFLLRAFFDKVWRELKKIKNVIRSPAVPYSTDVENDDIASYEEENKTGIIYPNMSTSFVNLVLCTRIWPCQAA